MGTSGSSDARGLRGAASVDARLALLIFFDGNFQSAEELVILRREANSARRFHVQALLRIVIAGFRVGTILIPFVEADGRLEDEEDIVTGALDFADRARNAI